MAEAAGGGRPARQRPAGAGPGDRLRGGGGARPRPRRAPVVEGRDRVLPRAGRRLRHARGVRGPRSRSCAAINRAIGRGRPAGAAQLREARHELVELLDMLGLARHRPGPGRRGVPDEVAGLVAAARGGARRARLRPRRRAARPDARPGLRDHRHPRGPPGDPDAGGLPCRRRRPRGRLRAEPRAGADRRRAPPGARGVGARLAARGAVARGASRCVEHTRAELGRLAGSSDHQGVVALTEPYPYADAARPAGAPRGRSCASTALRTRATSARSRASAEAVGRRGHGDPAPRGPRGDPDGGQGLGRRGRAPAGRPGRQRRRLRPRAPAAPDGWPWAPTRRAARTTARWPGRDDAVLVMGAEGAGLRPARAGRLRPPRPHPHVGARGLAQHLRGGRESCSSRHFATPN